MKTSSDPQVTELLDMDRAAAYLGVARRTLRKLIDRSRLRLKGLPVAGPTIQFFQPFPGASIRFRQAWLDAYVEAGTHRPETVPLLTKLAPLPPEPPVAGRLTGIDASGFGSVFAGP
jgi:hypothetical protein